MDSRVRNQVGLELIDIHIETAVEAQRRSQRRNDLSNQSVEISVVRSFDVQALLANIVNGLVVEHKSNISVLQQ